MSMEKDPVAADMHAAVAAPPAAPVVGRINPPELVAVNPKDLAKAIVDEIVARLSGAR